MCSASDSSLIIPPLGDPAAEPAAPMHPAPSRGRALATAAPPAPRGRLLSPGFLGLLATQFLVVWNDNMFRWLAVPIAKRWAGPEHEPAILAAGLASFVLPFLLLAAPAGFLADRFRKRQVIIACKVAELAMVGLGIAAIASGSVAALFSVVALLGAITALQAPARLGSVPEMVAPSRLAAANGLLGAGTILAVIGGTIAGNMLYDATHSAAVASLGAPALLLPAAALSLVAVLGLAASWQIRGVAPANPQAEFPWNPLRRTFRDLHDLSRYRGLRRAAVAIASLWSLASLAQLTIDSLGIHTLRLDQSQVGLLLGALSLGVALGSLLAGIWSRGQVELGFLALGSTIVAIAAILVSLSGASFAASALWLALLGLGAGLVDVPLEAYLQQESPAERRGSILAANNFLTYSGMLAMSGLYWVLRDVAGLAPGQVFLAVGIVTLPVGLYATAILPRETVRFFVWLASKCVYRVRVEGLEHLPSQGGALLVANHVSWIDGVLLLLVSPRPIRMMVYADYVRGGLVARLAKVFGAIPLKPGAPRASLMETLREARQSIVDGELVCIFPEGALTRDGQMAAFKPGALHILKGVEAPVVPIYLDGLWGSIFSYERGVAFWKWPRRWPYPVTLKFGKPIERPAGVDELRAAVAAVGASS